MRSAHLSVSSCAASLCIAMATACGSGTSPDRVSSGALATTPARSLAFASEPTDRPVGSNLAVQVVARDSTGNVAADFTGTITLSVMPDAGSLGGTTAVTAVAGVATFANLGFAQTGCRRLIASSAGLPPDTSATFCITVSEATTLAFHVQPTNTQVNKVISPAIIVCALDGSANVDTSFEGVVFVDLGDNPGSAVLTGAVTMMAIQGCATFVGLSLDQTGTGYTLRAHVPFVSSTSVPFDVGP